MASKQSNTRRKPRQPISRFLEKILVNPERVHEGTPCWEWQGATDGGYGRFKAKFNDRNELYAHRFAYRYFYDRPIPDDLEIDHKACSNRRCCNPLHLVAVRHAVNQERIRKERCKNGHPYTISVSGKKVCNKCNYQRVKKYRNAASAFHWAWD